jgi:arabinose-5-phosphate isomerase
MLAEARGIEQTAASLTEEFDAVIEDLLACRGRVVTTGIGKSGHIARKIAATFASTGTPSFFLHPAEASHGDLGMVTADDVILMFSNSGESDELLRIIPSLKRIHCRLVLISGRKDSTLASCADRVLLLPGLREAELFELAPTVSTAAMLALGDAMALVLLQERRFGSKEFALYHPAGSLGKKLILTVRDLMKTGKEVPIVTSDCTLGLAILEISKKGVGATVIVPEDNCLEIAGIITDGDIRRMVERNRDVWDMKVEQVMTRHPVSIEENRLAIDALNIMEEKKISVLPVVGADGTLTGLIHMHQILQAGVV